MAPTRKLAELFYNLRARTEGLQQDLDKSERAFGKLTSFVLKNPVTALAAIGTAAATSALKATQMAATIDASMRKVASAVPQGAQGIETLRKSLEGISVATGKTQEELAQAAEAIARAGAGSAEEVAQRLKAVTDASQASGADMQAIIEGLDQTLDLFGLSSASSSVALAELFSVAKGRTALADLFAQLQAAAPSIQKLGLDLGTASRALVQLGESGLSPKQAATELKRLASEGAAGRAEVERLAATIPKAASPMADLAKAAQDVNDSATNAGPRLRAEVNATLITLGNEILPAVNAGMGQLLRTIQQLRGGTTKDLQNAFATILLDGQKVFEAIDGRQTFREFGDTGGRLQEVRRSLLQLKDAANESRVDLQSFGVDGLGRLADQVAKFSRQPIFSKEQQLELRIFLGQITKAQAALFAAQNAGLGAAKPPAGAGVDLEELARQTIAVRDTTQAFDDLFQRALAGDVSLQDFDRTVRDLGDAFADRLKTPTQEQTKAFSVRLLQALEVRDVLAVLNARKAADQIESLLAAMTPTVVDDFRLRLRQLAEELTRLKASPEQVRSILGLQQALADAAIGSETLDRQMREVERSAISSMDAQLGLLRLVEELRSQLLTIQAQAIEPGQAEATAVRIAALEAQIERLLARIRELGGTVDGAGSGASGARSLASALSDAADFALGVSTALLGADDTLTRMIGGAGQVVSAFAKIADLAKTAGGLGKLFGSGAGIASALPAIGAAIGGIGTLASLIGREDPAARALREALDRTAKRLEEFTSSVGELVQVSVGGGAAAAVRDLRLSRSVEVGRDDLTGEPILQDVALGSRDLLAALRQVGVSLKELQQLAADFGVTFSDAEFPTAQELAQLQAFLRENAVKKLTDSLAGQLKLLALEARIDPQAFEGIAGVIRRVAVLTGDRGVPALKAALDGIRLDSADGPAQAIERLKQLLADFVAGDVDLSTLGDLNPEDFAETIAQLIEAIRSAAPALRTPAEQFAAAIEAFGVAVELGSLTAEGKLARATSLFAELFPELAASLDTSSAEAFRASLKSIIDGFAADGDLSEAERAQIAVLRALLGAFEGATPAAEQLTDALSVLSDRFAIFGTSAADQLRELLEEVLGDESIGRNGAMGLLRGLLEGLDLETTAGQSALRERAKAIFEALAEGGVTAEEQVVIDLLKRILGLAADVLSEAEQAAREAAQAAEEEQERRRQARRAALDDADLQIELRDISNPVEQLRVRLAAVAKAFPELADVLAGFDLSTQEGRDALEAWIEAIAGSPEALERLADATGSSVEELLAALLDLERGADAAQSAVDSLADKLQSAFDEVDFDLALNNITDPIERLQRAAKGIAGIVPEIDAALAGIDFSTADGRAKAEAALVALGNSSADATIRDAVLRLVNQIRGVGGASAGGASVGSAAVLDSPDRRAAIASAATITEVTANRWLDVVTTDLALSRQRNQILDAILATVVSAPTFVPPVLHASGVGAGAAAAPIHVELAVNFNGPVTAADSSDLARQIHQEIYRLITTQLATELQASQLLAGRNRI